MDFDRFKEINDKRLNYNEMPDATLVSSYRNIGCGDGYRLYLKIDESHKNEKIVDASFTTTGCGFGLASLAMATEWLKGKSIQEAEKITASDIEKLFEFPPKRKNYPESAVEAVKKAIADFRNGTGIDLSECISKEHALAKLKEQGHLRNEQLKQIILEAEDLHRVDFSGADLSNGYLQNTNFSGANFEGAKLRGAFLNNCNLEGANFKNADLRWCKLSGANIENTNFDGALYDIGTRLDQKQSHIFKVMKKTGKDSYIEG